jgi:hypothetical protein
MAKMPLRKISKKRKKISIESYLNIHSIPCKNTVTCRKSRMAVYVNVPFRLTVTGLDVDTCKCDLQSLMQRLTDKLMQNNKCEQLMEIKDFSYVLPVRTDKSSTNQTCAFPG